MTPASSSSATGRRDRSGRDLERTIAHLLTGGTYLSIGLMSIGVVLMLVDGISPLAVAPPVTSTPRP